MFALAMSLIAAFFCMLVGHQSRVSVPRFMSLTSPYSCHVLKHVSFLDSWHPATCWHPLTSYDMGVHHSPTWHPTCSF